MDVYPMSIESLKDSFIFKDGNHIRKLHCPASRKKQISKCGKYYNFEKFIGMKYNLNSFKFTKEQKTHSLFAKRLWNGLWEEGWREKQS
jgi:hypothetical protein